VGEFSRDVQGAIGVGLRITMEVKLVSAEVSFFIYSNIIFEYVRILNNFLQIYVEIHLLVSYNHIILVNLT
jgi:hypothetical protein